MPFEKKSGNSSPNCFPRSAHSGIFIPEGTVAFRDIPAPTTGNHRPVTRSSSKGLGKCWRCLVVIYPSPMRKRRIKS